MTTSNVWVSGSGVDGREDEVSERNVIADSCVVGASMGVGGKTSRVGSCWEEREASTC